MSEPHESDMAATRDRNSDDFSALSPLHLVFESARFGRPAPFNDWMDSMAEIGESNESDDL